jgi:ATP-binding cassette, subfamily B, bacterial MsbA
MNLYLQIIKFAKPFWKHIALALLLTIFYVTFNNISLWVSVDFIRELFMPEAAKVTSSTNQSTTSDSIEKKGDFLKKNIKLPKAYYNLNNSIKKIIVKDDKRKTLFMVCIIMFLSFLLKNVALYLKKAVLVFVQLRVIYNIRNKLHGVLLRLPLSYHENHHSGQINSIIFNDVTAINNVLKESFSTIFLTPIQIISMLILLVIISWRLTLITFIIIPVSGVMIIIIGKSIRRKSRRVYQQFSNVITAFQEAISGIRIVKAFTSEDKEYQKFEQANFKFTQVQFRASTLSLATSPLNETIGVLIFVALLWYGGNLVYNNAGLEAEGFIRFLVYLFAMFQPLKEFSGLNNTIQTGLAAAERTFKLMAEQQEPYEKPDSKELMAINHLIQYENINFQYVSSDKLVLHAINLDIQKGETVAFVGQSGSGKTTLVNLLPRFYELQNGTIKIDGIDTRNYSLTSLRKQMGIVTQDTILFNDTVRANIAYAMENVSEEKIIAAAETANAWEFIQNMEQGLDTIIGERGIKLSGGQKQRLSIARAILKNPPILILDEATSALDTESEKLVQEAIEILMKNRTVLVIAHRLSTIIHADKIVVMEKGKIIDQGAHRTLLKTCSLYHHLYKMQFKDEQD